MTEPDLASAEDDKKIRVLMLVTEDWYFQSHRADLADALADEGFDILLGTNINSDKSAKCINHGRVSHIPFRRSAGGIVHDLKTSFMVFSLIRRTKPHIIHSVALKPIIISLASIFLFPRIKFINAFSGLGYIFTAEAERTGIYFYMVRLLLKLIARRSNCWTLVQNLDDGAFLTKHKFALPSQLRMISGSGIKLQPEALSSTNDTSVRPLQIVLPARMLRDKGVAEFAEAAKYFASSEAVMFVLVGAIDPDNPAALTASELREYASMPNVEWWGKRTDMKAVYQQADIVCLPSYREGLPKVLLEAATFGIPLVATDVPGCREICLPDVTGLLVPPKDSRALAAALTTLAEDPALRHRLGRGARRIVEERFGLDKIVAETSAFYKELHDII